MSANCAPLVADPFCSVMRETSFCLFQMITNLKLLKLSVLFLVICMTEYLNIDYYFFDYMVNHIYPSELQLNRTIVSDSEASFLDLHLSLSDGFLKTKIFDKRDDFDFDIVNFPFQDSDVPRSTSYGVDIYSFCSSVQSCR